MDVDRIKGEARRVGGRIAEGVGRVVGDREVEAEGLVDQARGAVQNAYGRVKDTARDYADDVDGYVGQARGAAGRAIEQGRQYIDDGFDRLPDTRRVIDDGREIVARRVQDSPLAALLIAGAVGYGLALLLHRAAASEPSRDRSSRRRED